MPSASCSSVLEVWTPPIASGNDVPMAHQSEDVARLLYQPRINVWSGLGTGKTALVAWWLQDAWHRGVIDEAIVIGPGMVLDGWRETFLERAWPGELIDFVDARPPEQDIINEQLCERVVCDQSKFRVTFTTYGTVRDMFAERQRKWEPLNVLLPMVRGRRIALVVDESQNVAHADSGQSVGAATLASVCTMVAAVTATPIGNPLHLRPWGLIRLTRPDVLQRLPNPPVFPNHPLDGSFNAFKVRYAQLKDPMEREGRPFSVARAYPVDVYQDRMKREVLDAVAGHTCRRAKEECLDLPDKLRFIRSVQPTDYIQELFRQLAEDDRAILEDGQAVVPANILEERLRCLELAGGWLEGRPIHSLKLELLKEILEFIDEEHPGPTLIWASRTKEVYGAALIAAGLEPDKALRYASEPARASQIVEECAKARVGIIHGPTPHRERDRIQVDWKSGRIRTVVAHPGVAGAGLNWQHVVASVYYSQPLGVIARMQSEDRVHRHGLKHAAYYFDLVLEGGPDRAIASAHAQQREAESSLLTWLRARLGTT